MNTITIIDASEIKADEHNGSVSSDIKLVDKSDIKVIIMRTIKIKEDIYYGPRNSNKNKFVRMYKKLGLVWKTENIDGIMVDGWFNKDKSQYIIKIPEEGGYKRLKFYGCDEIYDYFISLGAVPFELLDKENITSSNYQKNDNSISKDDDYRFIGADLLSHHRTEQLLRKMPMDWGVIWK